MKSRPAGPQDGTDASCCGECQFASRGGPAYEILFLVFLRLFSVLVVIMFSPRTA